MATATRLIVLDRDGVINHESASFIKSPAEWLPIDGSIEAIALLAQNGFTVSIATNQSGLGRQLYDRQVLYAIHQKMRRAVSEAGGALGRIVYCPHVPGSNCDCRKPAAGLLQRLARYYGIPLQGVPFVGDSERDIQAAQAVGARPILVLTGNGQATRRALQQQGTAVETRENLLAAAAALVAEKGVA